MFGVSHLYWRLPSDTHTCLLQDNVFITHVIIGYIYIYFHIVFPLCAPITLWKVVSITKLCYVRKPKI